MIIIDTNALVVLLVGLIDTRLFRNHKRTLIYDEDDFTDLLRTIGSLNQIVTLPNIWTEVDNLLNNFSGNYKYAYIQEITKTIKETTENYLASEIGTSSPHFQELGLTDSLILEFAKECKLLITSDSKLSDHAIAYGIPVYDLVKVKNERLR